VISEYVYLARQLTAQDDFILEGVEVHPFADIPVADLFRIVFRFLGRNLPRNSRGQG
jgi:hypothetical protein